MFIQKYQQFYFNNVPKSCSPPGEFEIQVSMSPKDIIKSVITDIFHADALNWSAMKHVCRKKDVYKYSTKSETTVDILQSHLILKQKIEDVENIGGGGGGVILTVSTHR